MTKDEIFPSDQTPLNSNCIRLLLLRSIRVSSDNPVLGTMLCCQAHRIEPSDCRRVD
jgi:hypothetical protein